MCLVLPVPTDMSNFVTLRNFLNAVEGFGVWFCFLQRKCALKSTMMIKYQWLQDAVMLPQNSIMHVQNAQMYKLHFPHTSAVEEAD